MEKFLARQPIFNSERDVYGYELLFRSGPGNFFDGSHPEAAAASAVDSLFLFGIDRLTHGRRAFINCTRDFLLRDFPATLPTDRVVLEVLETVEPDDEIVAACRRLKNMGYLIALDDFQESPAWLPLTELAAFIKVDVLLSSELEQQRLSRTFAKKHLRLVAEKVESYDDFQRTLGWGYSFFQGYFFSRPEMLTRHDIPSNKLNYLRVLQAVNQKEMNLHDVSDCIKSEASLGYRLLRYLNSPAFPLTAEVHSIPHALSLLGERGVRRWVSLVAIACMGDNKPEELIMLPLIRAHFCESLAPLAGLERLRQRSFPARPAVCRRCHSRHEDAGRGSRNCDRRRNSRGASGREEQAARYFRSRREVRNGLLGRPGRRCHAPANSRKCDSRALRQISRMGQKPLVRHLKPSSRWGT